MSGLHPRAVIGQPHCPNVSKRTSNYSTSRPIRSGEGWNENMSIPQIIIGKGTFPSLDRIADEASSGRQIQKMAWAGVSGIPPEVWYAIFEELRHCACRSTSTRELSSCLRCSSAARSLIPAAMDCVVRGRRVFPGRMLLRACDITRSALGGRK